MILKTEIKDMILSDNGLSLSLAAGLSFTQTWIRELANANKENGPLTTAKALQVLRLETGLSDMEILEEDTEKEPKTEAQN